MDLHVFYSPVQRLREGARFFRPRAIFLMSVNVMLLDKKKKKKKNWFLVGNKKRWELSQMKGKKAKTRREGGRERTRCWVQHAPVDKPLDWRQNTTHPPQQHTHKYTQTPHPVSSLTPHNNHHTHTHTHTPPPPPPLQWRLPLAIPLH